MGNTRMSFTLRSVSVYSTSGECRIVKFRKSGLNILTGWAKTGKSSIIDILDYCFGRSECYVAEGVIRQHVSWYGVEIENKKDVLFIGRRNPGSRQAHQLRHPYSSRPVRRSARICRLAQEYDPRGTDPVADPIRGDR